MNPADLFNIYALMAGLLVIAFLCLTFARIFDPHDIPFLGLVAVFWPAIVALLLVAMIQSFVVWCFEKPGIKS